MLGFTESNNDVIVFLEGDEVVELAKIGLQGIFFNRNVPMQPGVLDACIDDKIADLFTTDIEKKDELITYMLLHMRSSRYFKLRDRGEAGEHQGWRHVDVIDVNRSTSHRDQYMQLKHWENQLRDQDPGIPK